MIGLSQDKIQIINIIVHVLVQRKMILEEDRIKQAQSMANFSDESLHVMARILCLGGNPLIEIKHKLGD